ncbi:nucleotidyltransferase domain-containing protein [Clostridium sp. AL.422]|uniref:nucleotidyltransferase domain-containing protein n=1 Tax=Clostridium TaxID=1485 RepID=UPI00293DDAC4|nr:MULTISPECIES: nucleotidyltransferase domain-containing protein [unclassified Clostridium]MDV4150730.1 nucleotidyltransferase domain-containing protein [Clostridium sp. AL.422]
MFEDFIEKTKEWAINEPFVEAIILVGSYARGTQKVDSDIDLVILTSNKQYYIDNTQILSAFGLIDRSNIEFYGECTSIRIWYNSGLEVEFGMVPLTWIHLPLDYGTERTLSDGYRILVDKKNMFWSIESIIPQHT